jgi:lipopolysaccharide/colanic/teichoic acid biosynthesis glycosyltransferase/glycosyltransferase involved in cell wall biosynthesis
VKILVVHQYYLQPGKSGGSRFNELARLWTAAGHEVTVLAGTADYASGEVPKKYQGRLLTREKDGQVNVIRCFTPRFEGSSSLSRMIAFSGFTAAASVAALLERKSDAVIATSPPLLNPLPGFIAARLRLRPAALVFEIRDLWPESAVTTGVLSASSPLTKALYALERWACRAADCINVLTPAFRDDLVKRGLAPESKIVFVPNGADEAFVPSDDTAATRARLGWGDRKVFLYAGAHGRANALLQLVEAAKLLRDRPDILIACAGDGPQREELQKKANEYGLTNIVFHGPRGKAEMPAIVAAADAGLAVLQDNPTFRTVYPNKVFDYMACAKPTVLAIDGIARKLVVDEARAGVFVQPERPAELAEAIRKLADDPALRKQLGEAGLPWVRANAGRAALATRYLRILQQLPSPPHVQRGLPGLVKGLSDRSFAAAVLLALSPVMGAAALAIALVDGGPVLFEQERPGRFGKLFRAVKFRTMRAGEGSDEQRLTRLGAFLRRTSLDELPQLWNVLRGDLSLVGPRPLLPRYLPRYSLTQARRHLVKPGLTGWAQVNGRNALSWPARLSLDVWYVENWSLWLDARILWRSLSTVLRGAGVSHEGHATMPEFQGEE